MSKTTVKLEIRRHDKPAPTDAAIDEVVRQLASQIAWCRTHPGNELLGECLDVALRYADALRPE